MNAKAKKRLIFGATFLLLLGIEICIALFVNDKFIRPYVGDILVIPLICSLFRMFFPDSPRFLGLYAVLPGVIAEILQLVRMDEILGIKDTVLGVILGSTFDIKDIICYVIGGVLFLAADEILRKNIN
jgi:hypothetical protein